MFAWFHTTLLSRGLTASGVPSIPVLSLFHSASKCFDVPLRYQALVSKWVLSPWVLQKETTWVARKVFLLIPGSPLRWGFLKVSCCLDQSVHIFFHHQNRHQALLSHRMLPGDLCICDLSWCVYFIFRLWLWFVLLFWLVFLFFFPAINYPNPTGKQQDLCANALNVMYFSTVLQQIRQDRQLEYTADFVKSFFPKRG